MNTKTFKIVVLPGDGIGPEVTAQALKLLPVIGKKEKVEFLLDEGLIGAVAIDETGNPLPDETIEKCKNSDAILLGAVGHPKYDMDPTASVRPEQGLLKIRKSLGLFANIRPVKTFPVRDPISPLKDHLLKGVDFVVFRELTGRIYFGEKGRSEDRTEAWDHCNYSVNEIERIGRMLFIGAAFIQAIDSYRAGKNDILDPLPVHCRKHIPGALHIDVIVVRNRRDIIPMLCRQQHNGGTFCRQSSSKLSVPVTLVST